MTYLHDLTWDDVFAMWVANEGSSPAWAKVATEVKGWPDWRSWRMFTANQLKLPTRAWKLYAWDNPMEELPAMVVGPYSGWQNRLPAKNVHTFADLVSIPEHYAHFSSNLNIQKMISHFPIQSCMTALRRPDGKIVCLEGHHRATAVAIARRDGQTMVFSLPPQVAVATLGTDELIVLDVTLARGTSKHPPAISSPEIKVK